MMALRSKNVGISNEKIGENPDFPGLSAYA